MDLVNLKNKFGVLLPISALPSNYGIGDLGPKAYDFINWLSLCGASVWQVLPTTIANPKTGCPYASLSAFGGYSELISPEKLLLMELLIEEELQDKKVAILPVDYEKCHQEKRFLLETAYSRFLKLENDHPSQVQFSQFCRENSSWSNDLAHFLTLSEKLGMAWWEWPEQYRDYQCYQKTKATKFEDKAKFHLFTQFLFEKQWRELRDYANHKGISFIGDIPIFISHHSMDAWKEPKLFKLNPDFTLRIQTGVPPDAFSDDGQTWSTPNYDWQVMQQNHFDWWKRRFDYALKSFDIIRFDHFIGLVNVFEIPPTDTHARNGHWVKTPGKELLQELYSKFPNLPMIVEDLGIKTQEVEKLKNQFHLSGMKILMFAYSGEETNEHLPKNYTGDEIVYTGTHDNNTLIGHFTDEASPTEIAFVKKIFDVDNFEKIHWKMIEESFKSRASLAIIPLQDLLGLDSKARFNLPGTIKNNWIWRFQANDINHDLHTHIHQLASRYNRQKL